MMMEILFRLILLHGPGGQEIWINPDTITSVRTPRGAEDHVHRDVHCFVNTDDGKFAAVVETCAAVKELGEVK